MNCLMRMCSLCRFRPTLHCLRKSPTVPAPNNGGIILFIKPIGSTLQGTKLVTLYLGRPVGCLRAFLNGLTAVHKARKLQAWTYTHHNHIVGDNGQLACAPIAKAADQRCAVEVLADRAIASGLPASFSLFQVRRQGKSGEHQHATSGQPGLTRGIFFAIGA